MPDFLEEKRREIQARLKELKPLVEEFHKLEAAEQALAGVGAAPAAPRTRTAATNGSRTRRAASSNGNGAGRRGRPKGSGKRAQQALELVRAKPGITIPEMAESMGIKQNYLYRVVPDLQKEGLLTKSGKGWHVREKATD
jgi:CRP-like cAMP-binding protein